MYNKLWIDGIFKIIIISNQYQYQLNAWQLSVKTNNESITACCFSDDDQFIIAGLESGDIKVINWLYIIFNLMLQLYTSLSIPQVIVIAEYIFDDEL